jgi:hypothetical protein
MKVLLVHNYYGSAAPSGENLAYDCDVELLRQHGDDGYFRDGPFSAGMRRRARDGARLRPCSRAHHRRSGAPI